MNFVEEGGRALAGGLMASREKTLVQNAARWLLRRRPFKPELIDRLCHDADELLGSSAAAEPLFLFFFFYTARINGRVVTLRD